MNSQHRKPLPNTALDYFDARAAVNALTPNAWDRLPYTARVHAENIVRKADPAMIDAYLKQLIEVKRDLDFPWFPARVVCHDILGKPRWSTWRACVTPSLIKAATRPR